MTLITLKQRFGFAPKISQIFAAAQFSLVAGLLLIRLEIRHPAVNFLTGMLLGFSIVGNIAALIKFGRTQREKGTQDG